MIPKLCMFFLVSNITSIKSPDYINKTENRVIIITFIFNRVALSHSLITNTLLFQMLSPSPNAFAIVYSSKALMNGFFVLAFPVDASLLLKDCAGIVVLFAITGLLIKFKEAKSNRSSFILCLLHLSFHVCQLKWCDCFPNLDFSLLAETLAKMTHTSLTFPL